MASKVGKKIRFNLTLKPETADAAEKYCKQTGISLTELTDRAIWHYIGTGQSKVINELKRLLERL